MDKKRFINKMSLVSLVFLLVQIIYFLPWFIPLSEVWPFSKMEMPGLPFAMFALVFAIFSREKKNDKISLLLIILSTIALIIYVGLFILLLIAAVRLAEAFGI